MKAEEFIASDIIQRLHFKLACHDKEGSHPQPTKPNTSPSLLPEPGNSSAFDKDLFDELLKFKVRHPVVEQKKATKGDGEPTKTEETKQGSAAVSSETPEEK